MLKSILFLTATLAFAPLMAMEEGDNEGAVWNDLPPEVKHEIFKKVPTKSHSTIARLNKESRDIAEHGFMWKHRYHEDFSEDNLSTEGEENWKKVYQKDGEIKKKIVEEINQMINPNYTPTYLNIYDVPFLPRDMGDIVPKHITSLLVNSLGLTSLPSSMRKLVWLDSLDLSFNNLRTLPEWLPELSNLTHIDVTKNPLEPESIIDYLEKMPQGCTFHLSGGQLKEIEEFDVFKKIKDFFSIKNAPQRLSRLAGVDLYKITRK